jgi:hypothetical protein
MHEFYARVLVHKLEHELVYEVVEHQSALLVQEPVQEEEQEQEPARGHWAALGRGPPLASWWRGRACSRN